MIDATPPGIPNYGDDLEDRADSSGGLIKVDPTVPSVPWYQFWNNLRVFCIAVRNAPKQVQQADLAGLLESLIQKRIQPGLQVWVPAPFNHMLRFDGTGFTFAPGDTGSGYTQAFLSAPTAVGWQLCNGATFSYLKADGTVANQILPNTAGLYFRR